MSNNLRPAFFTRGGQIVFHQLRMFFQVNKTILKLDIILFLLITGWVSFHFIGYEAWMNYVTYHYAKLLQTLSIEKTLSLYVYGSKIPLSISTILQDPFLISTMTQIHRQLMTSVIIGGACSLLILLSASLYFIRKGKQQTAQHFVRGARLVSVGTLKQLVKKAKQDSNLTIDGLPLIQNGEVQHFLIHGTVGQGKSQWIMKLMDHLRSRGDRVIIYDKGCSLISHYYQHNTDVILNPFDERCAPWDLWLEAPGDPQLENMAESLFPMHGETDPFWVNAARTVFSASAAKMRRDPDCSLEKLLDLLITGDFQAMEPYLAGTPAATLVSTLIEKTAISIRSVITTYLKSLQSLRGLNKPGQDPFSIRDYILNPNQSGWLFISSNGDQHKSLKPLISMWLAMASLALLSLPADPNRRIWFICDELPSLHKLPLLGEIIAEVRKFGGCFVLGMQSFSQLTKVYGRSGAGEIFDLLNTRAFFRSPSSEMAQLVAKELGDEDIEDTRENFSYGANSIRDGISLGKNRLTRPIVTFSEIMELDSLSCFLRLPGFFPVTKQKLTYQERMQHESGFVERKMDDHHQATSKDNDNQELSTVAKGDEITPTTKKQISEKISKSFFEYTD